MLVAAAAAVATAIVFAFARGRQLIVTTDGLLVEDGKITTPSQKPTDYDIRLLCHHHHHHHHIVLLLLFPDPETFISRIFSFSGVTRVGDTRGGN